MNFGALPIGPGMLGASTHHLDSETERRWSNRMSGISCEPQSRPHRHPDRQIIPRKPSPLVQEESNLELQGSSEFVSRRLSVHEGRESMASDDDDDADSDYKRRGRKNSMGSIDLIFENGKKQTLGLRQSSRNPDDASISVEQEEEVEEVTKPASLRDLFRFATTWNNFFNYLGLFAAIVSGVAQPLMTLVFGNLTTCKSRLCRFFSYLNV